MRGVRYFLARFQFEISVTQRPKPTIEGFEVRAPHRATLTARRFVDFQIGQE